MQAKIQYNFTAKMWQDSSPGGWFFVTVPQDISKEIRDSLKWQEEGWGRMKALARIEKIEWETAIWYDTKVNTYLLPIKAKIRSKASLALDEVIDISILL